MIKARLSNGLIVLGLTADNIRLLKEGRPILLALSQLGGTDDISIIYGETPELCIQMLEELVGDRVPDNIKTQPNKFEH